MNKEDFYDQKDSCYLRVRVVPENNTFEITLRNEYLLSKDDELAINNLAGNIARGMLELAYSNPQMVYNIGKDCGLRDVYNSVADELTEEQRSIWLQSSPSDLIH